MSPALSLPMILSIACGGAIGAVLRYLAVTGVGHWFGSGFPLGTMVVNIVGSFILGALVEVMALVWSPSPELRSLIVVGILGAFTTFSTFSLDAYSLITRGDYGLAALYVIGSVVLGLAAFVAGLLIFRQVLA